MLPRQLQRVPGWTEQLWGAPSDGRQRRTGAVAKWPLFRRGPAWTRRVVLSVCRGGPSLAGLPRLGLTIDLIPGDPEPWHAIPIHVAFPRQKLFERERVKTADLIERQPASAHRLDHGRLAPHRPPFPYRWQLGHLLECITRAILARGRIACDLRFHLGFPRFRGNLSRLTLQID